MDFSFTSEQEALRDTARSWLTDRYPAEIVADIADDLDGTGSDPTAFEELVRYGWNEATDAGTVEACLLLEEAGYVLLPAPAFVTWGLAAPFGGDLEVATTLAWAEEGAPYLDGSPRTQVDAAGRLYGTKLFVPDVASVERAVVTTSAGPRVIDLGDATVLAMTATDGLRRMSQIHLDGVPSKALDRRPDLGESVVHVRCRAAAEALGVGRRALEIGVAHAKEREQFGKQIGTYQAVSHRLADVYVRLQLARSVALWAWWAADAGRPEAPTAAAAALSEAAPAATLACEAAIQVLGGIGFTWEHPIHRYYKRSQWLAAFDGPPTRQRREIADAVLGPVQLTGVAS